MIKPNEFNLTMRLQAKLDDLHDLIKVMVFMARFIHEKKLDNELEDYLNDKMESDL